MIYYVMYLIGWARGLIWRAPDVAKAQPFTTSTSTRTSPIEIGAAYLDTCELGLHHLTDTSKGESCTNRTAALAFASTTIRIRECNVTLQWRGTGFNFLYMTESYAAHGGYINRYSRYGDCHGPI